MKIRILYISYDGILEPLGQSQIFAYLRLLAFDWQIYLISYEKQKDWENELLRNQIMEKLTNLDIIWYPLRYHKSPSALATSWDIFCGIFWSILIVKRQDIQIVHARSYVPSVIALLLKRALHIKYIFDMRGFWADERLDGGIWLNNSKLYKVAKWFEKQFLLNADYVVSLTHAAKRELQQLDYLQNNILPIKVIPTCADLTLFKPQKRKVKSKDFILGYVGTVSTWYLFDEVVSCYLELRRILPDTYLIIVNRDEHEYIKSTLINAGVPKTAFEINISNHNEMPNYISKMDAGIFFIKPLYSKKASAPTKLAEFLGCGIPCITNVGIGDMAELIEKENVGIAVKSFNSESIKLALQQLLELASDPQISQRCVDTAERYFSLDIGVKAYNNIYKSLSDNSYES